MKMDLKCCIDCEFFHAEMPFPKCLHSESAKIDYTDGSKRYMSTSIMRDYDHLCGPEAKYFLKKKEVYEDHPPDVPWIWIGIALVVWFVVYCLIF